MWKTGMRATKKTVLWGNRVRSNFNMIVRYGMCIKRYVFSRSRVEISIWFRYYCLPIYLFLAARNESTICNQWKTVELKFRAPSFAEGYMICKYVLDVHVSDWLHLQLPGMWIAGLDIHLQLQKRVVNVHVSFKFVDTFFVCWYMTLLELTGMVRKLSPE